MKILQMSLAALVLSGCAVQSGEPKAEAVADEDVSSTSSAVAPVYPWGAWSIGAGEVPLAPAADYFCVLTKVSGRFKLATDNIDVYVRNGYWYIRGNAASSAMYGEATCVNYKAFHNVKAGWTIAWTNFSSDNTMGPRNASPGVPSSQMNWLSYMGGKFEGPSENIRTYVSNGTWFDQANATGYEYTRSRSIANMMVDSINNSVSLAYAGEVTQTSPSSGAANNPYVDLGPTSDRFCFLTKLGGRWDGGNEWVEIKQSGGRWYLRAESAGDNFQVTGTAQCVLY